ncbi:helix-turn-helix transcriptional regulator [Catelliglobosispora koreensis]|uniref:helix-turn-helix transcriptional regulator n=1 Tax=Catelliglobosispora koreensis TaxID=129052 RepID=UPI00037CB398|nr:helix-turn-helix transcriptional regulator [Catelliglobosispora koreensis]
MLESLGLSAQAEVVYRAMLANPRWGVAELSEHMAIGESELRSILDMLVDLALLRPSWQADGTLRLVSPQAGLAGLLAQAEADVAERQRQIEATRLAIADLAAAHQETRERIDVIRHSDVESVRTRLEELAHSTKFECLSFSRGGAKRPEGINAAKPLNQLALERGVSCRNIYQESFRNDPATLAFARWMAELGSKSRIVPVVPMHMVIVDREVALVPINPADTSQGALEIHSPGMVAALHLLFEQVWESATPFGEAPKAGADGLEPIERELMRLLAAGHTDETVGRKLGLSVRTVRRLMAELTQQLGANSRFQAGVEAARRGWL